MTDTFRRLHEQDYPFVIPNPWDAGSAKLFASIGFEALATTSSGHAYTLGRADGVRAVQRDEALRHATDIVEATPLPVSADLERGYGDDPSIVAETVTLAAATGLAGCSIEDSTGVDADPIYEFQLAVARVEAAVEAARAAEHDFVLTARSENFIHGRPDLADTIARLQAFQEVGADVLYAPFVNDLGMLGAIVSEVERPVNALARPDSSVERLGEIGVKRISVGGAIAVSAMGAAYRAAKEIAEQGTFTYGREIPAEMNLDELFR